MRWVWLGWLGCGGTADVDAPAAPDATAPAAEEAPAWLVWTAAPDGATETVWVEGVGHGFEVRGRRDGVVVADGARLWAWAASDAITTVLDCDCVAENGGANQEVPPAACQRDKTVGRVDLVDLLGGPALEVAPPPPADEWTGEITQVVTPLASVGPYLFAIASTTGFGCGAADRWTDPSWLAIDLRSGKRDDVLEPDERLRTDQEERAQAILGFREQGDAVLGPDQATLVAIHPTWSRQGRLFVRFQYAAPACAACGDDAWGRGTRSLLIDARHLPRRLFPFAEVPKPIAAYWAAHPPAERGGFTAVAVPAERRDEALRAFTGG